MSTYYNQVGAHEYCSATVAAAKDLLQLAAAGEGEVKEQESMEIMEGHDCPTDGDNTAQQIVESKPIGHTIPGQKETSLGFMNNTTLRWPLINSRTGSVSIKHCRRKRSPTFELGTAEGSPLQLTSAPNELELHKQNRVLMQQAILQEANIHQEKEFVGDKTGHECSALNLGHNEQNSMKLREELGLMTSLVSSGRSGMKKRGNYNVGNPGSETLPARPRPLRATILNPVDPSATPASGSSPSVLKLLFDREYESLLLWQTSGFQAFTEEIQETLGGILKHYVREFKQEHVKLKHRLHHVGADQCVNNLSTPTRTHSTAACDHSASNNEKSRIICNSEVSPATCSKSSYTPCSDVITSAIRGNYNDDGTPYSIDHLRAGDNRSDRLVQDVMTTDSNLALACTRSLYAVMANSSGDESLDINSNSISESSTLLHNMKEQSLGNRLVHLLGKAMEAVVSVREAAQRIENHRSWMNDELNLARLELMKLRFFGNYSMNSDMSTTGNVDNVDSKNPHDRGNAMFIKSCNIMKEVNLITSNHEVRHRGVLREAMELSDAVHAFILELSSALAQNEHGVPWPLSRIADCSDVTPHFIEKLVRN